MKLSQTPVEKITVEGFPFYLKRDDLLHPDFSGNKARKLFYLLKQDLSGVDKLVGFGSPQANSLHSLAVLAKDRQLPLDYYVSHIPSFLQQNPAGNYLAALHHGANIIEVGQSQSDVTLEQYVKQQILPNEPNYQYVPEGGRYQDAEVGVNLLADEVVSWAKAQQIENLKVMLPAGTGTTALFLQKRFVKLALPYEVLTCACVGGDKYLRSQFSELSKDRKHHPTILQAVKKFHFGKLYPEFYGIWQQLTQQTGVEFELLYDPLGWITLLDYVRAACPAVPVLYIHQGGLLGNATMAARYARKFGRSSNG